MAGIHEKYDFYLDVPGVGVSQAYPTMKKLTWKWDKSNRFPRKTLQSSLTFYDNPSEEINDFTKVYPLERERRRCDRIKMRIDKKCVGGSVSEFWQGYWYVTDGKPWDVSHCEVTVKPETLDDYQCILDKEKSQLNILEYGTITQIKDIVGSLERKTCDVTSNYDINLQDQEYQDDLFELNTDTYAVCDGVKGVPGWTLLENHVSWTRGQHPFFPNTIRYELRAITTWIREFVSGVTEPPGGGWVSVPGGFARPVDVVLISSEEGINSRSQIYDTTVVGIIPNAVPFNEVMEKIMLDFCPQKNLVSNYFGINPDGTNPDNPFYQYAQANYQEMYYVPKSEILFLGASDRATGTPGVTFEKIQQDLYNMFTVEIRVRDGKYYLEHESYFKGNAMLNLREEVFEFYMKGNFKYEYINQQIPRSEKFFFADVTDETGDFDYSTIEYEPCSTNRGEDKQYTNQCITTNISGVVASGKKDDGKVSATGLVLVAAENLLITKATGAISGKPKLNGHLSWPILIKNALSYRRPLLEGKFYLEYLAFLKAWPQRKWTGKICMSCEDIDNFDMEDLVQTVLPWGEVDNATYDEPDGILTLEVLHD